jgi:hypothetical protein
MGERTQIAQQAAAAKRIWSAFRAAMWTIGVLGVILIFVGLFWPGAIALLSAAGIRIGWDIWAHRKQAQFDAMARPEDWESRSG